MRHSDYQLLRTHNFIDDSSKPDRSIDFILGTHEGRGWKIKGNVIRILILTPKAIQASLTRVLVALDLGIALRTRVEDSRLLVESTS